MRAVQNERKAAGLEVEDRIALAFGGDEGLLEVAREHEGYIAGETLAVRVSFDADGAGSAAAIDGRALRIAVERA